MVVKTEKLKDKSISDSPITKEFKLNKNKIWRELVRNKNVKLACHAWIYKTRDNFSKLDFP